MRHLDIGIVGGSISGVAAAGAMVDRGHRVRVFERSRAELEDRGLGIAMDPLVLAEIGEDLGVPINHRVVFDRDGVVRWRSPLAKRTVRWGAVHRTLAARLPNDVVETGAEVVRVEGRRQGDADRPWLEVASGDRLHFDLVIGADGIGSRVRDAVEPDFEPAYLGYVAIRGLVEIDEIPPEGEPVLEQLRDGAMVNGYLARSHLVAYPIEGSDGRRHVNWMWYRNVPVEDLHDFMTDGSGRTHRWSLPPGAMTRSRIEKSRDDAATAMPSSQAAIVNATTSLSVQAIFGGSTTRRVVDRLALVGDAARLAIPHVGAGTSLAISDAEQLAEAIEGDEETLDRRLARWDEARRTATDEVMDFGRDLGRFLQFSGTDWRTWTGPDFDAWWAELRRGRRMYFESS